MVNIGRGISEPQLREKELLTKKKHRHHENLLKHRSLIGARGQTLSRYRIANNLDNNYQVGVRWYLNEAHHDSMGADPSMMSMFIVGFLARFIYASALEAFVFGLFITLVDAIVWFTVRAMCPVIAKGLDTTESIWLTFVYNLFTFTSSVAVASYSIALWPGVDSISRIVAENGGGGASPSSISILWVDGVDFSVCAGIVYLLLFAFFSAFRPLYVMCLSAFAIFGPFSVAVLRYDIHEPPELYNSLLFASLSVTFLYACMVYPLRGTYLWNLVLAVSWYLFIISAVVGFGYAR